MLEVTAPCLWHLTSGDNTWAEDTWMSTRPAESRKSRLWQWNILHQICDGLNGWWGYDWLLLWINGHSRRIVVVMVICGPTAHCYVVKFLLFYVSWCCWRQWELQLIEYKVTTPWIVSKTSSPFSNFRETVCIIETSFWRSLPLILIMLRLISMMIIMTDGYIFVNTCEGFNPFCTAIYIFAW